MTTLCAKKYAVLGGSFDPVHFGHLDLADQVRQKLSLDSVFWVPAYLSPHKTSDRPAPAKHRLEMLRLALADNPAYDLSEIELQRGGVSYTVETLEQIVQTPEPSEWSLILGMDAFKDMKTWKDPDRILQIANIIVGTRPGVDRNVFSEALKSLPGNWKRLEPADPAQPGLGVYKNSGANQTVSFLSLDTREISSSEIRARIRAKKGVKNKLPPEVEKYIMRHLLYQAEAHPIAE